jgi:uncharacterized protein (DUF2062 family)
MFEKIKKAFTNQLTQGATPHGLALTSAFAFSLGVIPILGTTTLLCLLAGIIFKLNQPLIQTLNYLFYPLQILGIPIFIYIGESILGQPHVTIIPTEMVQQFQADWIKFFKDYSLAGLHGFFAWALIAPLCGLLLYLVLKPILTQVQKKVKA